MPLDRLLAERDRSGGRAGEQSRKEIHARDMKIAFQRLPAGFPSWQNGGFLTGFPPEESAARLALTRPSVPVSSAPWSTQAASPVRQRRLT